MTAVSTIADNVQVLHTPLLEAVGVTKCYDDQCALADISLSLDAREIIGLIGPNGAGKTTLLETIAGLLPVDSGEVLWRGATLPVSRRREFIFYLPDGVRPWDDQYVACVIGFFADVHRRAPTHVADVVNAVGLAPVLSKRVSALSKGFARRLMLVLALLTPQPVLLMDEPFDGFDLRQTRDIMSVLREVAANGRTLVLAIHQLADAQRIADRLLLLADGKLRGSGSLAELRAAVGSPNANLEELFLALT